MPPPVDDRLAAVFLVALSEIAEGEPDRLIGLGAVCGHADVDLDLGPVVAAALHARGHLRFDDRGDVGGKLVALTWRGREWLKSAGSGLAASGGMDLSGLRLFMSHSHEDRALVGEVAAWLRFRGLSCFVAHEDIEPTAVWEEEIRANLAGCDALAAFLTDAYAGSRWTDQEVGWVIGRGRPVIAVQLREAAPHALMAKHQSLRPVPFDAESISRDLLNVLVKGPVTAVRLADTFALALCASSGFDQTRAIMKELLRLPATVWGRAHRDAIQRAPNENRQVWDEVRAPAQLKALLGMDRAS